MWPQGVTLIFVGGHRQIGHLYEDNSVCDAVGLGGTWAARRRASRAAFMRCRRSSLGESRRTDCTCHSHSLGSSSSLDKRIGSDGVRASSKSVLSSFAYVVSRSMLHVPHTGALTAEGPQTTRRRGCQCGRMKWRNAVSTCGIAYLATSSDRPSRSKPGDVDGAFVQMRDVCWARPAHGGRAPLRSGGALPISSPFSLREFFSTSRPYTAFSATCRDVGSFVLG